MSFKADVSSVSPSSERMEFYLSIHFITPNYPVILCHRRSTTVSLEIYPLNLTYRFSNVDQSCRIGSWSEDKFFKLLLFRNLHRQQGNNISGTLTAWFDFFCFYWYRLKTQTETYAYPSLTVTWNMNNWAIIMRDVRYLRVTESSTDWLASGILLADGVYMKYMKITR